MRIEDQTVIRPLKQIERLNPQGNLIGMRVDYNASGQVMRTEHFLVPYKREDEVLGVLD